MAHMSELSSGGMVLGVDPDQRYHRGIFDLAPGDVLLAATDGLADSMNFEGRKFGAKRVRQALLDVLRLDPAAPAKRIAQHLHWERRRFTGVQRPTDDTTIVVVRVGEKRG
jgi:serine phosphatase RsbU (regulator of sigma subunit)